MYQVNQFYVCSKVTSGSELYYLCEVGRYLKNKGECLSLDGVIIDDELTKSKYWNYFIYSIENGYVTNVSIPNEMMKLKGYSSLAQLSLKMYFTTDLTLEQNAPVFYEKSATSWKWRLNCVDRDDSLRNSTILNSTLRSQALTSLIAMVAVERITTGAPKLLDLEFSFEVTYQKMALSDILLIAEKSNAFKGWVSYTLPDEKQCLYETWIFENMDKGYIRENITTEEKRAFFEEKGYKVGEPVFLYRRNVKQKDDSIKSIESCNIAVIREVDSTGISFDIINTTLTKLGAKKRFDSFRQEVKNLYSGKSYLNVNIRKETFSWIDIGVDCMLYMEGHFFINVDVDDKVNIWAERGEGDSREEDYVEVSSVEGVYWILKERGIEFNESHFLDKYFKNKVPLYTRYMNFENIFE